jgi:hypothetical protein
MVTANIVMKTLGLELLGSKPSTVEKCWVKPSFVYAKLRLCKWKEEQEN